MPFTITAPSVAARPFAGSGDSSDSDSDSDHGGAALSSRPGKRRWDGASDVVTPGEVITDNPQWMRGHGTYITPAGSITASVAGTLTKTNKLLSIRPLRARFVPEVGDLVVGRIVEVQAKRWRVDVGAAQLAALPLSAINLPGGILRKRTETDALQIRTFFAEGDLLVAEVQQLFADGAAVLHTRSLRYGKLRTGVFVALSGGGGGGGGGVVRARRQVWDFEARGGARVMVVLGVNGYCFVGLAAAEAGPAGGAGGGGGAAGVTGMEEAVSATAYSSQNDAVDEAAMREIARVRSVIVALMENGLKVDEDTVMRAYEAAVATLGDELFREPRGVDEEGDGDDYLGGEKGRKLADTVLASIAKKRKEKK